MVADNYYLPRVASLTELSTSFGVEDYDYDFTNTESHTPHILHRCRLYSHTCIVQDVIFNMIQSRQLTWHCVSTIKCSNPDRYSDDHGPVYTHSGMHLTFK